MRGSSFNTVIVQNSCAVRHCKYVNCFCSFCGWDCSLWGVDGGHSSGEEAVSQSVGGGFE